MSKRIAYLHIDGMHCTNCVYRIEKSVTKMEGIIDVKVNGTTNKGKIIFDENSMSLEEVINRINSLGFVAKPMKQLNEEMTQKTFPFPLFFSILLTIPLAFVMLSHVSPTIAIYTPRIFMEPLFQFLFAALIQLIIGRPFYERAYSAIKEKSANMDVLVVLSTSIAFFYSYFLMITHNRSNMPILYYDTSAFIITIILIGRYLEQRTKEKTIGSLNQLMKAKRKIARVIENGVEKEISIEQIKQGQIVLVKPGEHIPVDGNVIAGSSEVDESLLTGESIPIPKQQSSMVFAGTINHYGALYVKVTKDFHDTVLSNIIQTVQDAQLSKTSIQRIADRITAYFVPMIILIAIVTFFLSYFVLAPGMVNQALIKVIAVLIIACPCALGLATPTSLMAASGRGAQLGLLFKEGKYIERLSSITHIVFDKTGTITTGTFQVTNFYSEENDVDRLLKQVAAVERFATHPIGRAIYQYAINKNMVVPTATDIEVFAGKGIVGKVFGDKVTISNQFQLNAISKKMKKYVTAWKKEGKTIVYIYINESLKGIIAVRDQIKDDTKEAIVRLRKLNIRPIIASGDHLRATEQLAKQLNITPYYASCSPHDKAKIIQSLQKKGYKVAMVGDGINDAPALATADVGIAFTSGSDLAIQSSDVTTLSNNISNIVQGIMLSKKTMRNIKQNFAWAFFYNVLMIPFAMFGILAPWFAAMTMALSSLTVLLNSLRLVRMKLYKY